MAGIHLNAGKYFYVIIRSSIMAHSSPKDHDLNRRFNPTSETFRDNKKSKENPKLGQNFQTIWINYIRVIYKGQCKTSFQEFFPNFIFPSQIHYIIIAKSITWALYLGYVVMSSFGTKEEKSMDESFIIFINLNAKIYKTRWICNNIKESHHEI